MKKVAILLGVLLFLNACSLFSSTDHKDEISGVLTKQQAFDDYAGSHLLTDEDGEVYALNSTALNLSSQQYLDNKVKVQVEYDEENDVYSVTGVSVLEVLEKDNGKANWVSYMNQDIGFKLKYYDNWEVDEVDDGVIFYAPLQGEYDEEGVALPERDVAEVLTPITQEQMGLEPENWAGFEITESKIGANQMSAKKYKKTDGSEVHFFLSRDNEFFYEIYFMPYENFDNENENTFYEMLLEFQFVPFSETTGAEAAGDEVTDDGEAMGDEATGDEEPASVDNAPIDSGVMLSAYDYSSFSEFESLPYHFTAKYPSGWYYAGTSGTEDGVLHKYAFSDESVTDENEFASLKVLSGEMPSSGFQHKLPDGTAVKEVTSSSTLKIYREVDGRVYLVEGSKSDENILEQIIASITPVSVE